MGSKFEIGDVVSLKSWDTEGTKMTVEVPVTPDDFVGCVWFDKDGYCHRNEFKPESLQKV